MHSNHIGSYIPSFIPHNNVEEHTRNTTALPQNIIPQNGVADPIIGILTLPVEITNHLASFLKAKDAIALTSTNKSLFTNRFRICTHLQFKDIARIQEFLKHCRSLISQNAADQDVANDAICQLSDFKAVKQLTLTLSNGLTTNDINDLINVLPNLSTLNITLERTTSYAHLQTLLTASKNLTSLTQLSLKTVDHQHSYQGIYLPTELWDLSQLQKLELQNLYSIISIPDKIGKLSQLKTLRIAGLDSLCSLPNEIGQLHKLQTLALQYLRISALPAGIEKLSELRTLELQDLRISALPAGIGKLSELRTLALQDLPNISALPNEIGKLSELQTLELQDLPIGALPNEIGQLTNLRRLTLPKHLMSLCDNLQQQLPNCQIENRATVIEDR